VPLAGEFKAFGSNEVGSDEFEWDQAGDVEGVHGGGRVGGLFLITEAQRRQRALSWGWVLGQCVYG